MNTATCVCGHPAALHLTSFGRCDVDDVICGCMRYRLSTARRIDRTTDHTCPGLARDVAYYAAQGRSYFRCADDGGGHDVTIPVHYAQFSMICQDCRYECLDDSDVTDAACDYCGAAL